MALKEKPIGFTNAMAAAILAGQKTMTRRLIHPQPRVYTAGDGLPAVLAWSHPGATNTNSKSAGMYFYTFNSTNQEFAEKLAEQCPYQPGDKLWVREEHYLWGHWVKNGTTKTGKKKWKFVGNDISEGCLYSDNPPKKFRISMDKEDPEADHWYKRNPRFMPKKYARLWLEVESVDAQQIQSISDEDAAKEGLVKVTKDKVLWKYGVGDFDGLPGGIGWPWQNWSTTIGTAFMRLWSSIHGDDSWNNNDWVFAISFKRI